MTSFAFIAGLVPLVLSHGAGAVGNRTLGSSAMGGMISGTLIGVLIIPGLYFVCAALVDGKKLLKDETQTPLTEAIMGKKYKNKNKIKMLKLMLKLFIRKLKISRQTDKPS